MQQRLVSMEEAISHSELLPPKEVGASYEVGTSTSYLY